MTSVTKDEKRMFNSQLDEARNNLLLDNASSNESELYQYQRMQDREDLVKWQQDMSAEIIQFIHDLKREVYDPINNRWVPIQIPAYNEKREIVMIDSAPLCNDICIQLLVSALRPFMIKNELMSNYSEERVLIKLRATLKTLVRNICVKHDYYDIDFHDISAIRTIIQNYSMSGSFRAMNNGERKHLETSSRRIETVSQTDRVDNAGWFNKMFIDK